VTCVIIVQPFEPRRCGTGRELTDGKRESRRTLARTPLERGGRCRGRSHLSFNTGRAAHRKFRVLVCSPFGLTPGLSSKLSMAAV